MQRSFSPFLPVSTERNAPALASSSFLPQAAASGANTFFGSESLQQHLAASANGGPAHHQPA